MILLLCNCHERKLVKEVGRIFKIDNEGQIWRIGCWHRGKQGKLTIYSVLRKRAEVVSGEGYLWIRMEIRTKKYSTPAHRLVWQYFYGDIPKGIQINHKDADKRNNHPNNLELVTPLENVRHACKKGLIKRRVGIDNPQTKIRTPERAKKIRDIYATGKYIQKQIAERLGLSTYIISQILTGEQWPNAPGPLFKRGKRIKRKVK